jgi:GTP cyclohydrolase I|tara:strand:- start:834 stop:1469 length:636 start_codon:yes stop_codon:yes gene_type:complete
MSKLKYANGNKPLTEEQKQEMIKEASEHYGRYMDALKIDWRNDPNSSDTPMRVTKAFVNDLAEGCYNLGPKITAFDNVDGYDGMVFQGNIKLHSLCSHHHLPFIGYAHVAYIPSIDGKVIGLSKLNRIVEFYTRRPQVQENLTIQIHKHIDSVCEDNEGVAVMIEANHLCACVRGVKHDATMKTAKLSGAFMDSKELARTEFYEFIRGLNG